MIGTQRIQARKTRVCSACFNRETETRKILPCQVEQEGRWYMTVHFLCEACRRARQGSWRTASFHPKETYDPARVYACQLVPSLSAITLQEPYGWLIAQGFKDVENRSWHRLFVGRIFIHSGATLAPDFDGIKSAVLLHHGIVVPPEEYFAERAGSLIGVARFGPMVQVHQSRWKQAGKWCFPIQWAFPIEPSAPVRGQLGIWSMQLDNLPIEIAL